MRRRSLIEWFREIAAEAARGEIDIEKLKNKPSVNAGFLQDLTPEKLAETIERILRGEIHYQPPQ